MNLNYVPTMEHFNAVLDSRDTRLIKQWVSMIDPAAFFKEHKLLHILVKKSHCYEDSMACQKVIKLILAIDKSEINIQNSFGDTPLHSAIEGKFRSIQTRSSDEGIIDIFWCPDIELIRILLENGADIHIPNLEGQTVHKIVLYYKNLLNSETKIRSYADCGMPGVMCLKDIIKLVKSFDISDIPVKGVHE